MGRLKNKGRDLVRLVDPRFQSYMSPFESVRDKTGIFKATGNKAQKKVKKLINKEVKTERWVRWTLKKDARVLRRKESFCEDARRDRAGFLYALGGLDDAARHEVSARHKKLFDEIEALRAVIHTQKGFVTRIHALEKKEWNVAGELQHALTVMHTNADSLRRVIDSREQASMATGRDSVQVAGETSKLSPEGVRDLIIQEDATLANEMHAVQAFFDDCGKGLQVIEKWEQILNAQDHQLEQMQALNTANLDQTNRASREAEYQHMLVARLDAFSNTVRHEITLLHVMLKDGKVKHAVLKELKDLATVVEYLEDKTKAKTRRYKAAQQFGFLLVGRAAEAAILKVLYEVLQDHIIEFGEAVDESIATAEGVYETVGPGGELAIQYAIEAEYILQNKGEMVQEIGGIVADEVGERVDDGLTTIGRGAVNAWNWAWGNEPQPAPPPKKSVRARPKREYKTHDLDDLRPSERKQEIKKMQEGVEKFMAGYEKVKKVKEFPRNVHEKVREGKEYIGIDAEPVPEHVGYKQFMPELIITLLVALWTGNTARKTIGWAFFETITGIKERKEKEIARKLYETQYDEIRKQFEIVAQQLRAATERIIANKREIEAKSVRLQTAKRDAEGIKGILAIEIGENREAYQELERIKRRYTYLERKIQRGTIEGPERAEHTQLSKQYNELIKRNKAARYLQALHHQESVATALMKEIKGNIVIVEESTEFIESTKLNLIQEAEKQGEAAVVVMRGMLNEFQKIEADMDEKRAERGFFYRWGRRIWWVGRTGKNTVVWPFRTGKAVSEFGFAMVFPRTSRILGSRIMPWNWRRRR